MKPGPTGLISALLSLTALAGCQGNPAIPVAARYATAAAVVEGTVFIAGGIERTGGKDATVGTMEAYDPEARTWKCCAAMPTPRAFAAAAVIFGKVFVFGGLGTDGKPVATVEAYDLGEDRWFPCAPLPVALGRLAASSHRGSGAMVGGGMDAEGRNAAAVWMYSNDQWLKLLDLPVPRHGHSILLDGGYRTLLAIGGYDDAGPLVRTDLRDLSMSSPGWVPGPPLTVPRGFFGLATIGRRAYAVGGRCREIPPTEVLDLDAVAAGWKKSAPLPKDLCRFSMVEWKGHLLVFGGETGFGMAVNTDVLEYDPAADRWTER